MSNEEFITSYQYSPIDRIYIGEYVFPKNKDKEDIFIPPNTTLLSLPNEVLPANKCWKFIDNTWVKSDNPRYVEPPIAPEPIDYSGFVPLEDPNLIEEEVDE